MLKRPQNPVLIIKAPVLQIQIPTKRPYGVVSDSGQWSFGVYNGGLGSAFRAEVLPVAQNSRSSVLSLGYRM